MYNNNEYSIIDVEIAKRETTVFGITEIILFKNIYVVFFGPKHYKCNIIDKTNIFYSIRNLEII